MTQKLFISDIRNTGQCVIGTRQFWKQMGGTDATFKNFVKNGMDLDLARPINDVDVQAAVAYAEARIAREAANE